MEPDFLSITGPKGLGGGIKHTLSRSSPPQGGKKIALRGGWGDTEAHFPNPPPSLAAVTGGGI